MNAPVEVQVKDIRRAWAPLAASWLLMGLELPLLSAVVARLAFPEINLAAYGGVVFPLALIIESPVIMLLAASTALSRDRWSYQRMRRFMHSLGLGLTLLHAVIAFTPLYYVVVRDLMGVPAEIIEPARWGLMLMLPWTWGIAYRRFHQGVLIRYGHSAAVGWGTGIRLMVNVVILGTGLAVGFSPGIVLAACSVALAILGEALFVWWKVRPVLRKEFFQTEGPEQSPDPHPLPWPVFLAFYWPLSMMSVCALLIQPITASAISRLPNALEALAVWPAVSGLVFLFKATALAYNEVVVAWFEKPGGPQALWRFTLELAVGLSALFLLLVLTPAAEMWLGGVTSLPGSLVEYATAVLWLAMFGPLVSVFTSWFQGQLVHHRKTRPITEAVLLLLGVTSIGFALLIHGQWISGLPAALAVMFIGNLVQVVWLRFRLKRLVPQ